MGNEDLQSMRREFKKAVAEQYVVPHATFVLLQQLIVGLVRQNILPAEAARDIVNKAIRVSAVNLNLDDWDAEADFINKTTELLNQLLEHPLIKQG